MSVVFGLDHVNRFT